VRWLREAKFKSELPLISLYQYIEICEKIKIFFKIILWLSSNFLGLEN